MTVFSNLSRNNTLSLRTFEQFENLEVQNSNYW